MLPSQTPNILLIIGEDSGYYLGGKGRRGAPTPHLDRLASEGTLYTKGFATAPVCAPSRSSFVSGCYPWSIGTHNMRSYLTHPPATFMEALRQAGYYVSWPTKLDFNFEPNDNFCDDQDPWEQRLASGKLPEPFLIYRNLGITHESGMFDEVYGGSSLEREPLIKSYPDFIRCNPGDVDIPPYLPDTPEVRGDVARFFDTLQIQDRQLGEILSTLDNSPYAKNTIVLYTADHGRGLVREKRWPYPAGLHIPFIVRGPGIPAGVVSERLLSGVDLAPTILSLCGLPAEAVMEGQAFLGEFAESPRSYAFSGRDRMDEVFDRVRTVSDGTFFYVQNDFPQLPSLPRLSYMEQQRTTQAVRHAIASQTLDETQAYCFSKRKPCEELYQINNDPWCIHNLANDPEYTATKKKLESALARHRAETRDIGLIPERELEESGFLRKGTLDAYAQRIQPLPQDQSPEGALAPLTVDEVQAD